MQGLDKKVIVFKYKRKKHYRRTIGHRQVLQLSFYFGIQLLSKWVIIVVFFKMAVTITLHFFVMFLWSHLGWLPILLSVQDVTCIISVIQINLFNDLSESDVWFGFQLDSQIRAYG
jgi:hypothetical protein